MEHAVVKPTACTAPQTPQAQLKDLKPLLQQLFYEEAPGQNQSPEQLQSKIDQLQALQQLLQVQQQGLKQQQLQLQRDVKRPPGRAAVARPGNLGCIGA